MKLNKNGKQTRLGSLIEASANTLSGFIVSLFVWEWIVAPLYGVQTDFQQSLEITAIFTVTSILRSYFWRRGFSKLTSEQCFTKE